MRVSPSFHLLSMDVIRLEPRKSLLLIQCISAEQKLTVLSQRISLLDRETEAKIQPGFCLLCFLVMMTHGWQREFQRGNRINRTTIATILGA